MNSLGAMTWIVAGSAVLAVTQAWAHDPAGVERVSRATLSVCGALLLSLTVILCRRGWNKTRDRSRKKRIVSLILNGTLALVLVSVAFPLVFVLALIGSDASRQYTQATFYVPVGLICLVIVGLAIGYVLASEMLVRDRPFRPPTWPPGHPAKRRRRKWH